MIPDARVIAEQKNERTGYARTIEIGVRILFRLRRRWTPDGAARRLGINVYDVRPTFSKLSTEIRDHAGHVIRPAYIRKTKKLRRSFRGNPQHIYERLPDQLDMSEYWS